MYWLSYQLSGLVGSELKSAIIAMMVACGLPFVWAVVAKWQGGFRPKDNESPRAFLAKLDGLPARANAIQVNSFESLPMFLVAVLLAIYCFVPQTVINSIAWLYVLLRIGFGVCYLANWASLRSILWALSMACIVMLFWWAIRMVE